MNYKTLQGDALEILKKMESQSVDCVITSPPYFNLRDYGVDGQIGLESTPTEYISKLADIFDEVKRVLKDEGTLWVNLGDTYAGNKKGKTDNKVSDYLKGHSTGINKKLGTFRPKTLLQIPSRFAIEMTDRGWILRNRLIWHKPNVMPTSVKDRFTIDYEDVFFFVKEPKYYFEQQLEPLAKVSVLRSEYGLKTDKANGKRLEVNKMGNRFVNPKGRNKRTVWSIPTSSSKISHIAMFPQKLVEPMVLAGCPVGGVVLDIFMGSGTTGVVAKKLDRNFIGIDISPKYCQIARSRLRQDNLL